MIGRCRCSQVIVIPLQAIADKISTEPDVRFRVVEIIEGQGLCRGDLGLDPVKGDLGDLHQSPGPGIGIGRRVKVALGADEGVQDHRIYAVFPGVILNIRLIALRVFPALDFLLQGGKQQYARQGQRQQDSRHRHPCRPFLFFALSRHVPPSPIHAR